MITRIIFFSLILIVLLSGCSSKNNKIISQNVSTQNENKVVNNTDIDEVISDYIISHTNYKSTDKEFEAHKIYGKDEKNNTIKVYLYSSLTGFSFKDGYFKGETGGSGEAIIELSKKGGQYEVISFRESFEKNDLKGLFPKEYEEKISMDKHDDLYEAIKNKANAWLKSNGKNVKILD